MEKHKIVPAPIIREGVSPDLPEGTRQIIEEGSLIIVFPSAPREPKDSPKENEKSLG